MHEFKHGELKSGRGGKAGKVKSRRQAVAIALQEAGASKYDSAARNRRNLRRTETKEAQGRTAQQEREGRSHVGASGERESTKAMAGATPASKPREAIARPSPAPARAMATPVRSSTQRQGSGMSRAARR